MKSRTPSHALIASLAALLVLSVVGCGKVPDGTGAAAPSTTLGTTIDDSVVTSNVKAALLADPDVKSFDIKVETRKGEVQLSGFVDSQTQIDRATAVTRAVSGVKRIQNNVVLKSAPTTAGAKVDDGITTAKVKAALLSDPYVKSFDIAVVTNQNEVMLSGYVDNKEQMDRAIAIARGIEGVRRVNNEMSIKK